MKKPRLNSCRKKRTNLANATLLANETVVAEPVTDVAMQFEPVTKEDHVLDVVVLTEPEPVLDTVVLTEQDPSGVGQTEEDPSAVVQTEEDLAAVV